MKNLIEESRTQALKIYKCGALFECMAHMFQNTTPTTSQYTKIVYHIFQDLNNERKTVTWFSKRTTVMVKIVACWNEVGQA